MDYRIRGGEVSVFSAPLKRPFVTALGRKTQTTNVGIRVRLKNGAEGYGEASGSVVMARLKPERLARALKRGLARVAGRDVRRLLPLVREIWSDQETPPPAAAALECALTEACSRSFGFSLSEWFGGAARELETDITLSAGSPEEAAEAASQAVQEGFRTLKAKVGTGFPSDLRRVSAVWDASRRAGARPRLILDGNQSMTPGSALRLVDACLKRGMKIALLEQPLPREALAEARRLKRLCAVPIAADESVRSVSDAIRVLDMDAADVLNVKVAKTGLWASLEIVALARAAGKKLMIGCMQESAAGLSASVHLACGTGAFEFVDLDSDHLLAGGQPSGDFTRRGPSLFLNGRKIPSRGGWPGPR